MHNKAALKRRLRKLITGLSVPQEYCCLEIEKMRHGLSVFMTCRHDDDCHDVTDLHLLLGYKPLIVGLPFEENSTEKFRDLDQICLSLLVGNFKKDMRWHGFPSDSNSVARLILKKIGIRTLNSQSIIFYQGEYASHKFLNSSHQLTNFCLEKLKVRSPNNIGLPGNLHNQVRVGYAVPRRISIVTTSDGELMNMFPTDLHGPVGTNGYAGSLRIGGEASNQVEKYRKIVLSDVEVASYKQTYDLGKNHMQQLRTPQNFSVHAERSKSFGFPLPRSVIRYYELDAVDAVDFGIHRIHLYRIINRCTTKDETGSLGHIHQYYAQWRIDRGLDTELLYR
jgi:hypothetical protein